MAFVDLMIPVVDDDDDTFGFVLRDVRRGGGDGSSSRCFVTLVRFMPTIGATLSASPAPHMRLLRMVEQEVLRVMVPLMLLNTPSSSSLGMFTLMALMNRSFSCAVLPVMHSSASEK